MLLVIEAEVEVEVRLMMVRSLSPAYKVRVHLRASLGGVRPYSEETLKNIYGKSSGHGA